MKKGIITFFTENPGNWLLHTLQTIFSECWFVLQKKQANLIAGYEMEHLLSQRCFSTSNYDVRQLITSLTYLIFPHLTANWLRVILQFYGISFARSCLRIASSLCLASTFNINARRTFQAAVFSGSAVRKGKRRQFS